MSRGSNAPAAAGSAPSGGAATPGAPPPPPIAPTNVSDADEAAIARAVELLRAGEVVAFPTETVYGLGADASSAGSGREDLRAEGPAGERIR